MNVPSLGGTLPSAPSSCVANVNPNEPGASPAAKIVPINPKHKSMPPLTRKALPPPTVLAIPKDLYYNQSSGRFPLRMPGQNWVELSMYRLITHLKETFGLSTEAPKGELSETEQVVYFLEQYRTVDFAGAVGGYREGYLEQGKVRILVTSGPELIPPSAGDWSMVRGILENMLGDTQLPYLYGWLKVSLQMFAQQTWMAGQVLVLCGPPESGKNLLAFLIQQLFGGREPGKPYDYMTQATSFNADVVGAELLTIEDEISHTNIESRRRFGARIKDLAVNKSRRLHKKYVDGMTVVPLQRLVISLNDEPDRVMILPPVEPDIADKMMILQATRREMPMPTDTPQAEKAFGDALIAQLPAFVDFLNHWEIPEELRSNRMGVAHYHHPAILEMLSAQAPEAQLLRLIDEVLFPHTTALKPWYGKAVQVERLLVGASDLSIQREAKRLLPSGNCCGRYLGRLAERGDGRVTKHPGSAGIHNWTIRPPEDDCLSGSCTTGQSGPSQRLIDKVRGIQSAGTGAAQAETTPKP